MKTLNHKLSVFFYKHQLLSRTLDTFHELLNQSITFVSAAIIATALTIAIYAKAHAVEPMFVIGIVITSLIIYFPFVLLGMIVLEVTEAIANKKRKRSGLYHKYRVSKRDGSPTDPDADYFVLRIDTDAYARIALREYAEVCRISDPELSKDILDRLNKIEVFPPFIGA